MKTLMTSPIKVNRGDTLVMVDAPFDADSLILTSNGVVKGPVDDEVTQGMLTVFVSDKDGNLVSHRTDYYTR